jgi:hypothetical protein
MVEFPLEAIIAGAITVLGIAYGLFQNRHLNSALKVTQAFAQESAEYLRIKGDGTITVQEKESLGEAAIRFFEAIEEATGAPVLNSPAVPWIKPVATEPTVAQVMAVREITSTTGTTIPKLTADQIKVILAGHTPVDQHYLKEQILAAEAANLAHYYIRHSGGVYLIYWGQQYGTDLTRAYTDIPIIQAPGGGA